MAASTLEQVLNLTLTTSDPSETEEDDFDDLVEKLRFFFSENLLLAALDLVDRENVVKVVTPWGYSHYQVFGSTATYTVFPGGAGGAPSFCTCPAYVYSVVLSGSELMCKHVLAVAIANRMSRCGVRNVSKEHLAEVAVRQYS